MPLHDELKNAVKEAMRERNVPKLNTIRGLLTDFTNELVIKRIKPTETLGDDDALAVIKRSVKRRLDSIEQFKAGNRPDLVKNEEEELQYIQKYIPQTMSREEIKKTAIKVKEKMNVDKTKSGMLVGAIMKELKGKADGGDVKAVVDELFA